MNSPGTSQNDRTSPGSSPSLKLRSWPIQLLIIFNHVNDTSADIMGQPTNGLTMDEDMIELYNNTTKTMSIFSAISFNYSVNFPETTITETEHSTEINEMEIDIIPIFRDNGVIPDEMIYSDDRHHQRQSLMIQYVFLSY